MIINLIHEFCPYFSIYFYDENMAIVTKIYVFCPKIFCIFTPVAAALTPLMPLMALAPLMPPPKFFY